MASQKRSDELLRKVFEILLQFPEGLQAKDVLQRVAQALPPTDYERGSLASGVPRFDKIVRFATISTVHAGWLIKDAGRWIVTEDGRNAYQKLRDPEAFGRRARDLYQTRMSERLRAPSVEEIDTPEASSAWEETDLEEAEEAAQAGIQAYLQKMPPYDFQKLVATLLRAMGHYVAWSAPPGPDKGIDIVAYTDPLGTTVPRIKVQVKRRADKISVEEMRSFMAILSEHDVGIFVSLGGFTSEADSEARTQHHRRVTLIGLKRLLELWVEFLPRIDEGDRKLLPLRPVHYLASTD
jgi:restriction system protein